MSYFNADWLLEAASWAVVTTGGFAGIFGFIVLVIRAPQRLTLFLTMMLTTGGCLFMVLTMFTMLKEDQQTLNVMQHNARWLLSRGMMSAGILLFHTHHLIEALERRRTKLSA
jgi:hypothetical protein